MLLGELFVFLHFFYFNVLCLDGEDGTSAVWVELFRRLFVTVTYLLNVNTRGLLRYKRSVYIGTGSEQLLDIVKILI